jgi:hypothetical protein
VEVMKSRMPRKTAFSFGPNWSEPIRWGERPREPWSKPLSPARLIKRLTELN